MTAASQRPSFFRNCFSAFAQIAAVLALTSSVHGEASSKIQAVMPILENYCYDCHGDGLKKGGVALDSYRDESALLKDQHLWQRIRDQLDYRIMPPPDEDAPDDLQRAELIQWIDQTIFPVDPANPDPGQVTIRRLNRTEYHHTIRDLLGVELEVEDILPADDAAHGFDTMGDSLTLSPVHLERYFDAAEKALERAVHLGPMPRARNVRPGSKLHGDGNANSDSYLLFTNGEAKTTFEFPRAGTYRLEIAASGTPGGTEPPKMELRIDGRTLETWEVPQRQATSFAKDLSPSKAGKIEVAVAFTNDFYDEHAEDPDARDRNLIVHHLALVGPLDGPEPEKPESHRRLFGERGPHESDELVAQRVLKQFTRRAFRRPATADELSRLTGLAVSSAAGDIEHGIREAMLAVLVSPPFLFREERSAAALASSESKVLIDEYALASRLSYFLWSSAPDDELLSLAEAGKLRAQLKEQIARMIASDKSTTLADTFVGQWLQIRDLSVVAPDLKLYPEYSQELAKDMRQETELLFVHLLRNNLPPRRLIDADFTFINERLATHYGIPDVSGNQFRQVSLQGTPRRGILGHASVLTLTSSPTRTSPVMRGKFILDNLLNMPPPAPPQDVPALETSNEGNESASMREQLDQHRADPNCSSCHALMDPLGFGLENFDAIGRWRTAENGHPIDASGTLISGESFVGAGELFTILEADRDERFLRALAAKLLTFGLGRGLEYFDKPAIDAMVAKVRHPNAGFQDLIVAAVESVPFQYQRGKAPAPSSPAD